jgi:phosphoribosylamine--glycine ligase
MEDYSKNYAAIHNSSDDKWPLLIESLMGGSEISFTVFVDDHGSFQILPTSMDYARRYPGPPGPNNPVTGGMSAISPHPLETLELIEMARLSIVRPFLEEMKKCGILRKCVLYFGCFISVDGFVRPIRIRVSEINIRMGEPEVQTVIRRLRNPGELLLAMFENRLQEVSPEVRDDQISFTIALVTGPGGPDGQKGYPWSCTKGEVLEFDLKYLKKKQITLVPSGADFKDGTFYSDGTRVAYLVANAQSNMDRPESVREKAINLREKLLTAFRNGKVRVIPRENPQGNRLSLREDCGLEFSHFSRIFCIK